MTYPEKPDNTGKAPIHKATAIACSLKDTERVPMQRLKLFGNPEKMFAWRIEKDGDKENISISEHGRATGENEKDLKIVRSRILKNTTPEMVALIKENSVEYVSGEFKTRICKANIIERLFELSTIQKEINLKIAADKENALKAEQKIYGKLGQIYES